MRGRYSAMPRNGMPALTFEQVHHIRTAGLPDWELAKLYGVCPDSIGNARRGRTYKDHTTPPAPVGRSGRGRYATPGAKPASEVPIDFEPLNRPLFERLRAWAEVDVDGCWIWTGGYHSSTRYPSGHHGFVSVAPGVREGTHRAMWMAVFGEIPEALQVLHECDKPKCIRPKCLWIGTHGDNMADMYRKGRHAQSAQTHCKRGHPLSPENLYASKSGRRICRICSRAAANRYIQRKRQQFDSNYGPSPERPIPPGKPAQVTQTPQGAGQAPVSASGARASHGYPSRRWGRPPTSTASTP